MEANMKKREAALREREVEPAVSTVSVENSLPPVSDGSEKNWPPCPTCLPIRPCFRHHISQEIPPSCRCTQRFAYLLWWCYVFAWCFNVVAAMSYLIVTEGSTQAAKTFAVALLLLLILVPISFLFWYRCLYKAFKKNSSFNFFMFFVFFILQMLHTGFQALGVSWYSGCGWIIGTSVMKTNQSAGVVMYVSAAVFTLLIVMDIILLLKVHRLYRRSGSNFEKAKKEFAYDAVRNEGTSASLWTADNNNRSGYGASGERRY